MIECTNTLVYFYVLLSHVFKMLIFMRCFGIVLVLHFMFVFNDKVTILYYVWCNITNYYFYIFFFLFLWSVFVFLLLCLFYASLSLSKYTISFILYCMLKYLQIQIYLRGIYHNEIKRLTSSGIRNYSFKSWDKIFFYRKGNLS